MTVAQDWIRIVRPRRLRRNEPTRRLVRETRISPQDFVQPVFVREGEGVKEEIRSMPGVYRFSVDMLDTEIDEIRELGIQAVMLFGLPLSKDELGKEAYNNNGIVQKAIRHIRELVDDPVIITDVCLCQYTSHGHCGIVRNGEIINDASLELLAKTALSHAEAGADIVAPSAMMDHQVRAIRKALDSFNFENIGIMSYSAKYASAFYGPFREAADSSPSFGDRRSHQMDIANSREAMKEIAIDIQEGADIIMIKPAMLYLDIVKQARQRFDSPIAAFSVSGEYSMIKTAAQNGLVDEERAIIETLTSIKRAGADITITYFAKDAAKMLRRDAGWRSRGNI